MTRHRILGFASLFLLVLVTVGNTCGGSGTGTGSTALSGFGIHTEQIEDTGAGFTLHVFSSYTTVTGNRQYDLPGAAGNVSFISITTDLFGDAFVNGGRAPANWRFGLASGPCGGMLSQNSTDVYPGGVANVNCIVGDSPVIGGVNPSSIDGDSPPSTLAVNINGSSFFGGYDMPQAWVYDVDGDTVYSTPVDNVSADGTTASFSGLPALYSGTYFVLIRRVEADGSLTPIGGGQLNVIGNDRPALCDPDGSAQEMCSRHYGYFWDPDTCTCQPAM